MFKQAILVVQISLVPSFTNAKKNKPAAHVKIYLLCF